jgi:hypothetical protein
MGGYVVFTLILSQEITINLIIEVVTQQPQKAIIQHVGIIILYHVNESNPGNNNK